jgi:CHAD domain-containing protein
MKNRTFNETRYSFLLPEQGIDNQVFQFLRDADCDVQPQRTINHEDTYLDTFDWRLFKNGLSLRLRKEGGRNAYILRNMREKEEGASDANDIRCETTGKNRAIWDIDAEEIKKRISELISPRRLIGHVSIRTRRLSSAVVCPDGKEIELYFDSVLFQTNGHEKISSSRLHELRLELKNGEIDALDNLAQKISERFSLTPSSRSKLETAIERLKIHFPAKNPPVELTVRPEDRLDTAVNKILAFQLHRFQEHIPGTIADIDTEFVHQARVSTRKMRSLLRLCADAVPQRSGEYFTGELLWLASLFGQVRDLDVFLLNLAHIKDELTYAPSRAVEILRRQIMQERAVVLADLKEGLLSPRMRIFSLRLSTFSTRKSASRPQAPLALSPVSEASPVIISALFTKAIARGKRALLKPKLENFHSLRIQFKKLRYASEFFNPAFNGALSPFIGDAEKIQDCLGELQDTVFTKELITGLMKKWRGSVMEPRLIFILGEIYRLQEEISRNRQDSFQQIWERFDREETRIKLNKVLGLEEAI